MLCAIHSPCDRLDAININMQQQNAKECAKDLVYVNVQINEKDAGRRNLPGSDFNLTILEREVLPLTVLPRWSFALLTFTQGIGISSGPGAHEWAR